MRRRDLVSFTVVVVLIAFRPAPARAADAAGWTHWQPGGTTEDTGTTTQNADGSTTTTFGDGWTVTSRPDNGGTEIVEKDDKGLQRTRIRKWPNGNNRSRDTTDPDTNTHTTYVYDANGQLIAEPTRTKLDPDSAFGVPVAFDPGTGKWHPKSQASSGSTEAGPSSLSLVITAALVVALGAWEMRRRRGPVVEERADARSR